MKKILLIRFSSIGDIVLTTPVIRCLKQQLKEVEIHVITKSAYQSIYENNPNVSKVFDFSEGWKETLSLLKAEHYDFVVDLHKNWRSFRVRLALRCRGASFPKLDFRKFLYTKLKIKCLPNVHLVDRYFRAVVSLGVKNDGQGLDFFFSESDVLHFADLPEEFRNGFAAVVIGGQHATKVFPDEKVVAVCRAFDKPVVLIGGSEDFLRGEKIVRQVGTNIGNGCGRLSIGQSASLLNLAEVVLTNDTGMMHIAAALRKPIVSVWGNTVPEYGFSPYLPQNEALSCIIENKNLKCRPCHKLGYKRCPKRHFACMNTLDPALIAQKMREMTKIGTRGS